MLNLQGFPKSFKIVCNYSETRKQAGNSVPIPMIAAVINEVLKIMKNHASESTELSRIESSAAVHQESLPINY